MPGRIGRRRFLQFSASGLAAGVAYGALRLPVFQAEPKPAGPREVLTKEFHLGPPELSKGSRLGLAAGAQGLELERASDSGHYLSSALKSDFPFNYAGLFWSGSNVDDTSIAFWMRSSPDGRVWSGWEPVQVEMAPGPLAEYDTYGSLIWADRARYVQFLSELQGSDQQPTLQRVGLVVLNPYDGPALQPASEAGSWLAPGVFAAEAKPGLEAATAAALAPGKPITFSREQWGADERLRFGSSGEVWPRAYVPTKKLVVHHTATTNGYTTVEQAKAQVRAVYTYHASTLGWGDIGYNCLIDKFGNSYEGRRGRDGPGYDGPGGREILSEDVVAGHALQYNYGSSGIALLGTFCSPAECAGAAPSASMISKLREVLTWECRQHGINPLGSTDFVRHDGVWHRGLPNVIGHRDVFGTTCPGGNVYALLPQLRRDVAARLASSLAPTVSISSAPPQGTVSNVRADYAWAGSGGLGDREYSYYLEGWTRIASTGDVNYIRGFTSRKTPAWTPWTAATSAHLCLAAAGLYTFHVRVRDSTGRIGVYQDTRSFLGTAPTGVCDGALLRGSAPDVFIAQKGLKRHVVSRQNFIARGFSWDDVLNTSDSFLNSIPTGQPLLDALADGNLLKGSAPDVYVMESGQKRHAVSKEMFLACGYFWDAVMTVPDSLLGSIPTGPPLDGSSCPRPTFTDGTLLQGSAPDVWVMEGGQKRHAVSAEVFLSCGYKWGNVNRIADSTIAAIPEGPPLSGCVPSGTLLRGSAPDVFLVQKGLKRHVVSLQNFIARGFSWGDVLNVSDSFLNSIPTGQPLLDALADGNLLKGSASDVYVMESRQKRHAVSAEVFLSCGHEWGNVNRIADSTIAAIPEGPPLSGCVPGV